MPLLPRSLSWETAQKALKGVGFEGGGRENDVTLPPPSPKNDLNLGGPNYPAGITGSSPDLILGIGAGRIGPKPNNLPNIASVPSPLYIGFFPNCISPVCPNLPWLCFSNQIVIQFLWPSKDHGSGQEQFILSGACISSLFRSRVHRQILFHSLALSIPCFLTGISWTTQCVILIVPMSLPFFPAVATCSVANSSV